MIAVWSGIFESELVEQTFPIVTGIKKIGDFENEQALIDWLLKQEDSNDYAVDYLAFIRHNILTPEIYEYLFRYKMLNKGIHSYSNVLDDMPAIYVDVLQVIESEVQKAMKAKPNG